MERLAQGKTEKTIAEEFQQYVAEKQKKERLSNLAPLLILALVSIMAALLVPGFFSSANFNNLLNQVAIPLVLATGLCFVIVIGGIDLSLEGVMGFAGSLVTLLVLNNKTPYHLGVFGIALVLLIGLLVGALMGAIHVAVQMPSFIVTFGMGSVMTGFGILTYRGKPASVIDPLFTSLSQGKFLFIPYLTWIAIAIFMIGCFIQYYTSMGRAIYAIGSNELVAISTGLKVKRYKVKVFAFCSFCVSAAGVMGAIRLQRGEVAIGKNNLFTTITSLVVGGASLSGGKGGMMQALIGVAIVTVLQNCMILLGVKPVLQEAIKGVIIIAAVSLSIVRGNKVITK